MRGCGCGKLRDKADRGIFIFVVLNDGLIELCSRWEFDDGEGNYFSWAVAGPNFEVRK